ncbi:alpha/beta fold hydrolase [Chloroflexota bacterium]
MSIYVLVHASLMGGWCWREVANYLRAEGHEVFTPTLTGLGERAHLLNRDVGLYTHVQDIVGVLECEDLQEVILVGYSYAGMVITGVAEKVPERLSRMVYLDALVLKDGQSFFDIAPPELTTQYKKIAEEKGDGWLLPYIETTPPRFQPQPLLTATQALEIKNPAAVNIPRAYIHCTIRPPDSPLALGMTLYDRIAEEAKANGWWYRDIEADHGVVFTHPREVTDLLLELA